tara:strand:+ start:2470 stop:2754 length:285 start_codon:yes stop_codon:yes gene_type:complete
MSEFMKFLHDKKKKKEGLVWKGREQEWAKEKYQNKLKEKEENEKSEFVTKSMFELQFGFKDAGDWYVYDKKNQNKKYFDKYEYYKGTYTQKERR